MMVSKEEMVDVLKTAAVSRFLFCPGLYLAIGVSSWANYSYNEFFKKKKNMCLLI